MGAYEQFKGTNVPIKCWTKGVPIEPEAIAQLQNTSALRILRKHIAVMPDVHCGMGATIGSVIATVGAVIPSAVGVDIGCGMMAAKIEMDAEDLLSNTEEIRLDIERSIPVGFGETATHDRGGWHKSHVPDDVEDVWYSELADGYDTLLGLYPDIKRGGDLNHLGTLGSGNHFIEICLDENNEVWAMLHSGSRGVGNRIGRYFIKKAKEEMERYKIRLPDKDLAFLVQPTDLFHDYLIGVSWAQDFAMYNRRLMMENIYKTLEVSVPTVEVECHHNFVAWENHYGENMLITRKGACRAREGEMVIIPGSMGARSYIARGKGSKESFQSCSHGAGRKMSRRKAKETFSLEDHAKATEGVECRKDASVLDETPGAYKSIEDVMDAQTDLVEIVHTLKQVLCVKG